MNFTTAQIRPVDVRQPVQDSADRYPMIATTPDRLERMRSAYQNSEQARTILDATFIEPARNVKGEPIHFPPRGGHHNMWYRCRDCEVPLNTLSDTKHQCPDCEHIYTGEPYDDVIFARQHAANLRNAWRSAWAYAITEDEVFARYTAKVLLGYSERYAGYEYRHASRNMDSEWAQRAGGRLDDQTLDEANFMARQIAPAFDLIRPSEALDSDSSDTIRENLIRPMLETIRRNQRGKNNWQSFHNAAYISGGALLDDAEQWVALAINDPAHGFLNQLEISITDDGMWYEGSWSYHHYSLQALVLLAMSAEHLGINLWDHPRFKRMYTLPLRYVMPDGSLPRFGNASDPKLSDMSSGGGLLSEPAYAALQDEQFRAMLPRTPTWLSVMYGSEAVEGRGELSTTTGSDVMPAAGHVVLRTNGDAGLAGAAVWGPHGGYHSHLDRLSFMWFAHGQELGLDRGRMRAQAYQLPIHTQWYRHTLSHNTVMVDEQAQRPADGELLYFAANDAYAAAVMQSDQVYEGVKHRRLWVMTPTYIVVFDALDADSPRRFDWLYHHAADDVSSDVATDALDLTGRDDGFRYLRNTREGRTDEPIEFVFRGDDVATHLRMTADDDTWVMTGDGPSGTMDHRDPMVLVRHDEKQSTRFAAVIEPVKADAEPTVTQIRWQEEQGYIVIQVDGVDWRDEIQLADNHHVVITHQDERVLTPTDQRE
ncbi:heparinase II/III family protein [Phycisphaerales bacterium AB-hyl4]|uniref:Heparinase II/III family protein n=1 Tax=Natronomicrosphaera hydrolytica TaxID=3242702 RepID=A0ABV4U2K3_9BACT